MADYKKLKSTELPALLARRGLEPGGTKTQMLSRLVTQDAEDAAAEKATAAAIRAASTDPPPTAMSGKERGKDRGRSGSRNGGTERGSAGKKSEAMRKARVERAKKKGKGKGMGKQVGGEEYHGALARENEGAGKGGDVDEERFVRDLMAGRGGYADEAVLGSEYKSGIIVSMTAGTPTLRGGGRRTRTERKASSALRVVHEDDDAFSDASTVRPSSVVAPEMIPLPEDKNDFRKASYDFRASMGGLLFGIFIAMVCVFATISGSMAEIRSFVAAFAKDPVRSVLESIMGPK